MWEAGKKEEDVIFWETRKWALCSSISIYGVRIVNIAGDIWYWDEEICVRPFSFKPLSLHGLLLFKKATIEKEGFGEKKAFAAAFPKPFFLCPSPKWVLPFMTLLFPFLPNSFSIQQSGLQPLISVCSPASISHTPPYSFPERGWVLVWELLFPLDFSSWQPICRILWPQRSCSPETVMLILQCSSGVISEHSPGCTPVLSCWACP